MTLILQLHSFITVEGNILLVEIFFFIERWVEDIVLHLRLWDQNYSVIIFFG